MLQASACPVDALGGTCAPRFHIKPPTMGACRVDAWIGHDPTITPLDGTQPTTKMESCGSSLVPYRCLPTLVEKFRLYFERARSICTLAGYHEPAAVHESMPEAAGLTGGVGDLIGRCPDPPTGFVGGRFRPWCGWDFACFDSGQVGCVVSGGRAPAGASGCCCHVVMGWVVLRMWGRYSQPLRASEWGFDRGDAPRL